MNAHHWGRPGLLLHRLQECTPEQHSRPGIQLQTQSTTAKIKTQAYWNYIKVFSQKYAITWVAYPLCVGKRDPC